MPVLLCACDEEMFSLKNDALKTAVDRGAYEDVLVRRDNPLFTNVKSSGTLSRTRSASDGFGVFRYDYYRRSNHKY